MVERLLWYVLQRLSIAVGLVFALITIAFLIFFTIPADPAAAWAGPLGSVQLIEQLRKTYRLDDPLYVQYFNYIWRLLHGDLGISPSTGHPVIQDLQAFLPHTVELLLFSMILASIIGVATGVITAVYHDRTVDHVMRVVSLSGLSTPNFWLALLLQILFFSYLGLLPLDGVTSINVSIKPITGFIFLDSILTGNWNGLIDALKHIILPGFVLAFPQIGIISRLTRASMLEVLRQDYVKSAKAMGLPLRIVLFKRALQNAILPVMTQIGLITGQLLGGAVVVEVVFSWPGIGRYVASATLSYLDLPAILGVLIVVGSGVIVINLIVDVLYRFIDPRIRLS